MIKTFKIVIFKYYFLLCISGMVILNNITFPGSSVSKESACSARDLGSNPWLGRTPGERNGKPLQYPYLENAMDRGAWWAVICGITKSQT